MHLEKPVVECVEAMNVVEKINPKKLSILWVSFTRLDIDLNRMALLNILGRFAELGHEVSLIAVRSKNISRTRDSKVRVISVPLRDVPFILPVMFTIFLSLYLPIFVIVSKVDVIIMDPYVHILSVFPQLPISRFKKVKFVLDVRSIPVETAGFRGFQLRFWFNTSILVAKKVFDGMTIITPLMREEICRDFRIDPCNMGTWPSGVDTELFNPENYSSDGTKLKKKLGLSDKFVVLYHGVFTATRGLKESIESMKILRADYPKVVLFLLGTGPMVSKLKQVVQKAGLQEHVIINDPVDYFEVPKFIKMSDVCIVPLPDHPYWRFQCPLKLLEYLAMEKVVILTDIPAHRVVIDEAKCGVYLSSVNPMEISEAIEYVYLNKDSLNEQGKIGREIVKKEYTWEKVAGSLENYLLSIYEPGKNKSNSCHRGLRASAHACS
jgi:glycosyltransferase involved in cell wall biosynthesis